MYRIITLLSNNVSRYKDKTVRAVGIYYIILWPYNITSHRNVYCVLYRIRTICDTQVVKSKKARTHK